jgi:Protein of unknown function (DUF2637)
VTGRADRWIPRTTTGCVTLLALIAATVSYLHMHRLVELHGQLGWVAALTPLSVDGIIVAASTTLLADSGACGCGGVLPWALLVTGSVASLSATAFADHGAAGAGEALAIMLRPGNAGSNTASEHIEATRLALAQLHRRQWR